MKKNRGRKSRDTAPLRKRDKKDKCSGKEGGKREKIINKEKR